LIAELINHPAFRDMELQNIKQLKKQRLLVDLQKTSFVAAQKFTGNVFGKEHPYGRLLDIENIESTTIEMVLMFYQEQLKGNFEIVVSGQVDEHDLKRINETLGQEPRLTREYPEVSSYNYGPSELLIEKEDSLQSSVRMGMAFINRDHPDYNEMLVVNEILGGYFGSRLMRNIREDKGYTYGIHSGISCLNHGSLWIVSTDVKKEFRDQTVDEIIREIQVLQNELVPQEELETVKNYMLGTFISETDTPFALADKFKTIHYSGLGYDYYRRYFQTIKKIDSERIQELARKYLVLENLSKVVVG
jgi:predicted Zn-dependent peptidase